MVWWIGEGRKKVDSSRRRRRRIKTKSWWTFSSFLLSLSSEALLLFSRKSRPERERDQRERPERESRVTRQDNERFCAQSVIM